ncbi:MAG: hypothetical protein DRI61_01370 [Chloroflexi bacterium]|nr:MAG: hypothetical protein DRI61_01370 [Chloroflexota bacterium]
MSAIGVRIFKAGFFRVITIALLCYFLFILVCIALYDTVTLLEPNKLIIAAEIIMCLIVIIYNVINLKIVFADIISKE